MSELEEDFAKTFMLKEERIKELEKRLSGEGGRNPGAEEEAA